MKVFSKFNLLYLPKKDTPIWLPYPCLTVSPSLYLCKKAIYLSCCSPVQHPTVGFSFYRLQVELITLQHPSVLQRVMRWESWNQTLTLHSLHLHFNKSVPRELAHAVSWEQGLFCENFDSVCLCVCRRMCPWQTSFHCGTAVCLRRRCVQCVQNAFRRCRASDPPTSSTPCV